MNPRYLIMALAFVAVAISCAAIVTHDGGSDVDRPGYDLPDPDDPLAGTKPTEGNDEHFQMPYSNNESYGHVEYAYHEGSMITFRAVPENGYALQCWQDASGGILGYDMMLTMQMSQVVGITAVFGSYSNKVVELDWQCPIFSSNGIEGYTPESLVIAISGDDYVRSINGDHVRGAGEGVRTPASLLSDDYVVVAITDYLSAITAGMPDLKRSIVVMTFVQDAIAYTTDMENYGTTEFWATPLETVYCGRGDCEDTAALFVNLATRMGLDAGFVAFDYASNGHMSAAVKLTGGASVSGGTTFVMDGSTYAYVETASDMHVPLGYLSPAYDIADGKFTPVTYADGVYTEGTTKTIGVQTPVDTSSHISYSNVSRPPVLEMRVGDSFSYTAETNMGSEITAEGTGLEFFTFDGETDTLYGTATQPGDFEVTLKAVWTRGELSQTAYQIITFHVSGESEGEPSAYSYSNGVWAVEPQGPEGDDGVNVVEDNGFDLRLIAVLAVIAMIGLVAVVRVV